MKELEIYPDEALIKSLVDDEIFPPKDSRAQFYADPETLKHGSGYYTFMNALPMPAEMWVENCQPCRRAMKHIMLNTNAKVEAIPGTDLGMSATMTFWTANYLKYRQDPKSIVINPAGDFWFCEGCAKIWTSTLGFWCCVSINGETSLSIDRLKLTEDKLREQRVQAINNVVIDPGIKPSEDSTKCSNCHVWRTVEPYESYPGDGLNRTHHVCPKCHGGEIYDPKPLGGN
jgi:hypothetical protein